MAGLTVRNPGRERGRAPPPPMERHRGWTKLADSYIRLSQNFASQSHHGGRVVELSPRMRALVNGQQKRVVISCAQK